MSSKNNPPVEAIPPNTDAGPGVMAELYILTILSIAIVGLRSYARLHLTGHWGWDDTMIVVSMVFLIIGTVLLTVEIRLGIGKHLVYLADPEQQALDILKFNTFFQMTNVLCTLFTKISIAFYILRIRDSKQLRRAFGAMMLLMSLATLAVIIVLCVSCTPTAKLWSPELPGTCLPLADVYNVAYVQSAFTILIDLALTASPIIILWNVQIRRGRKSFILLLMSLGLTATVCNALRSAFMPDLTQKDYTYGITPITIVAILEMASGIIAASVPACMPFLYNYRGGSTTHPSTYYRQNNTGPGTGHSHDHRATLVSDAQPRPYTALPGQGVRTEAYYMKPGSCDELP